MMAESSIGTKETDIVRLREEVRKVLDNPRFLGLRHDVENTSLTERVKSELNKAGQTVESYVDTHVTAFFLNGLLVPELDPRERIELDNIEEEHITGFLRYIITEAMPVYFWEWICYTSILRALGNAGLECQGGLVNLVLLKKRYLHAGEKIPFSAFRIIDPKLAKSWFVMPVSADPLDLVSLGKSLDRCEMLQEHTKKQEISTKELDCLMAAATNAGSGLDEKESASQYIHTIKTAVEEACLVGFLADIHQAWGQSVSSRPAWRYIAMLMYTRKTTRTRF